MTDSGSETMSRNACERWGPAKEGIMCPACGVADKSEVKDKRPAGFGSRQRRVCACGERFTTAEVVVPSTPGDALLVRTTGRYNGQQAVVEPIKVGLLEEAADVDRRLLAERIAEAVNRVLGL